jgi:hypothetical protein
VNRFLLISKCVVADVAGIAGEPVDAGEKVIGLLNNIDKFLYDGSAGFHEKSTFNKNS